MFHMHAELLSYLFLILGNISLSQSLRQFAINGLMFDSRAFLHRGPVHGVGEGIYLINSSQIYLITERRSLELVVGIILPYY